MSGKGSGRRPTDEAKYQSNWDLIFNKNKQHTNERKEIEGIMSTPDCGHPFCDCLDKCKEAK